MKNMVLRQILGLNFLSNSVSQWLVCLAVFFIVLIVLRFFRGFGLKKLAGLSERTRTNIDDLIIKIIKSLGGLFYFAAAFYIALGFVALGRTAARVVYYTFVLVLAYYAVRAAQIAVEFGKDKIIAKRREQDERFEPQTINLLAGAIKAVVWLFAAVIVLDNLGYNITALAAGLGVGGIAVAFALQNILTDIFASFSIYFDKPFQVGDFITVGADSGTVKKIGIKSTRLQSTQGEELIISNKELTEARVRNYKRLEKRRVTLRFGLEYSTPVENLKRVPEIVKDILDSFDIVEPDRVHFKELGDFSLNFEAVFFVKTTNYARYLDIQQAINLALLQEFDKQGIVFAYPSQTVYLEKS